MALYPSFPCMRVARTDNAERERGERGRKREARRADGGRVPGFSDN